MKSHTRLLVSILLISTIANTTGCSKINETKKEVSEPIVLEYEQENHTTITNDDIIIELIPTIPVEEAVIECIPPVLSEEIVIESIPQTENNGDEPSDVSSDNEKNIEELLREYLYDENIDYKLVIKTYLEDYDNRSNLKNEYLRAIYMLMINSDVSMETYLKELHTMTLMQQIPMCVPEDIWYESFGNLIELDPECLSLFDMFSEFAIFVHDLQCEEEHTLNEFDCYTCPKLEEEYTRKLTIAEL